MEKEPRDKQDLNKYAAEVMRYLQDKKLSFAEALDVLSTALVVSALNAEVDKKEFIKNTNMYWDDLRQTMEDNKQANDLIH
jgi:flagellar biosynthesis/type III secretory pathway chaperone